MTRFRTLHELEVANKRVLVRVDFNVPLENGRITDDSRIRAALPTIKYLRAHRAIVLLLSHLGRPEGVDDALRMDAVAARLSELLKTPVLKLDDCIGAEVDDQINEMLPGEIALLENVRFHAEEEKNDDGFARSLADLADVYVNDAFGAAHRAHASVSAICKYLPAAAGFLMEKEISMLSGVLHPKKPFVVVLGGAKVSDKIGVIDSLAKKADAILIGGAMMFTFLKSKGYEVGKSKCEMDKLALAKKLLKKHGKKIVLPVDCVVAKSATAKGKTVSIGAISAGLLGLDIGNQTCKLFSASIRKARTVFWNGPLGLVETPAFRQGTACVARAIAQNKGMIVAGGGDTLAVLQALRLAKRFRHVSTGGGASMEFLEGRKLPGIAALEENCGKFKKS
ncbi:phosphoglycerate kinase [Candidatus Woesearchaeota archaeon]|nr:phosphoglycerate kinase [Candidatus Woesearchaeota archaeon]